MQEILILEDLPEAAAWLAETVVSAFPGARVTLARNLAEASELLDGSAFDLALIDLQLPDGSWVDLIARLAAEKSATLCVVSSIYDDDRHIFPALQAGATGYLLKERPRQELVDELQGMAAGRPPLSPAIARRLMGYFQALKPDDDAAALTPRETEVLQLVGKGIRLPELSEMLEISRHTAADYVKSIYRKLNINSRAEAAVEAMRRGLI